MEEKLIVQNVVQNDKIVFCNDIQKQLSLQHLPLISIFKKRIKKNIDIMSMCHMCKSGKKK